MDFGGEAAVVIFFVARMSEAISGVSCRHGEIPAQSHRRRKILLYVDAGGSALNGSCRSRRRASRGLSRDPAGAAICDRCHCSLTGPPARDPDIAYGRRRLSRPVATHQRTLQYSFARFSGTNLKRHANGELALWQRRYWEHTIRDDDDFARHVDYIHYNPVKHRLVRRVRDWPHSSFHLYVRRGVLPEDWAGDVVGGALGFGER